MLRTFYTTLKARVTRRRSLVLDKQKRFQLSSELADRLTAVKQAACCKAACGLATSNNFSKLVRLFELTVLASVTK